MLNKIKMFFSAQGVTITALLLIILGGAYYLERNERISLEIHVHSLKTTNETLGQEMVKMREQAQALSISNKVIKETVASLSKDFENTSTVLKQSLKRSVEESIVSPTVIKIPLEEPIEIDSVWEAYQLALGELP